MPDNNNPFGFFTLNPLFPRRKESASETRERLVRDLGTLGRVLALLESLSDYSNCKQRRWQTDGIREIMGYLESDLAYLDEHGKLPEDDEQ